MDSPFFSVIVPNYNAERYIKKCLDSLSNQSFKDFEIVITDDCSADNSVHVIESYKNENKLDIVLLKNEVNSGPGKSRESAVRVAKGQYIAFCDSDDWYDNNYLKLAYDTIIQTSCDVCLCGFKSVLVKSKKEKITYHRINNKIEKMDKAQILTINIDGLCTMVVKRTILDDIKFPDIRNGEDMALIPIIMTRANSFAAIEECPYNYLYRVGSASMSSNMGVVDSLIDSYKYVYNHLSNDYSKECEYLGMRNLLYGAVLNLFKFSFNKEKANEIVDSFEMKYPNWSQNEYWTALPYYKKIFLKAISQRRYLFAWSLAQIHTLITR